MTINYGSNVLHITDLNKFNIMHARRAPAADYAGAQQAAGSVEAKRAAFETAMVALGYPQDYFQGFYAEGEHAYYRKETNLMLDAWRAALDSRAQPVAAGEMPDAETIGRALKDAIDGRYPIPNNPHNSVVERAMANRVAFRHGWDAAVELFIALGQQCADNRPEALKELEDKATRIDTHLDAMRTNEHYRERVFNDIVKIDAEAGLSRFERCADSRPAGGATDHPVIRMLLDVARAAHDLLDDTEESGAVGDSTFTHTARGNQLLSEALNKLDDLPDDQPGYVMGPAAKAAWALRQSAATLAASAEQAAPEDADHPLRIELQETRDELARTKAKLVLANTLSASAALPGASIDTSEFRALLKNCYAELGYDGTHAALVAHIDAQRAPVVAAVPHEMATEQGDGEATIAYINGWNDCRDTMLGKVPDDPTNRAAAPTTNKD